MADPNKEMSLDDAANAVGQMENFFKAFRRVSDLVLFLRTADQRKKELEAEVALLETTAQKALSAAAAQRDADGDELKVLTKKITKAKETIKQIEAEAEVRVTQAEAKVAEIEAKGKQRVLEADVAVEAALLRKAEIEAEATAAEERLAKARETLAAMAGL